MINLWNLADHPLAQHFYDLALELEKLPADVEQTNLIKMLADLQLATQTFINCNKKKPG